MNIYAVIILATIIFGYLLDNLADIFNLKALSGVLPDEFKGVYEEETYRRSQAYTRVKTKFGFLTSTFGIVTMLLFWFMGGFRLYDSYLRTFTLHPIITGLLFIGGLMLIKFVLSLPFGIYDTFVIEERFGFNKTTPKTFILDIIKGFFLSVLLGGPILAVVLAFFQYAGAYAWIYCWIATTVFSLFIHFIAPTWIMPLFNKFTPLEEGELKKAIFDYADKVKYSLKNIFVMDGSKRSSKSNAFFTGFGKNKRIALFDTLIEKHTVSQLVSVLAHEIGHYKKKHIIKRIIISVLHSGIVFFLLSIFIGNEGLSRAFYMEHTSIYSGLVFFGMLYSPIELILSIFLQMFSRKNEYEADRFAVDTTGDPASFIDALKILSKSNLSNLTPHPFYVFLNYSHPPVLDRIRQIRC